MTSTNEMTKEERREYWLLVIDEFQSGNLTKTEYCKNNGIPFSTFQYWYKKFVADDEAESGNRFAELVDPALEKIHVEQNEESHSKAFPGELAIQYGDICIQINSKTPMTLLTSVLGVLGYA